MHCIIIAKNGASYAGIFTEYLMEKGLARVTVTSPAVGEVRRELTKMVYHYALIDLEDDGIDGLEVARIIKKTSPRTHCLIRIQPDDFKLDFLIHFDISGYLSPNCSLKELMQCFELLNEGYRFMSGDIREKLSRIESVSAKDFSDNSLTKQENRILNLVMKGKSTGEIARELFLSINTINNHKTRIRNKLNLQSNRQLVAYVMQWRNRVHQNAC
ncbi:MAG: response regulator transcription factor [Chitinophaga sp.]|uniref:helix-turn-helix transcriptional regulator n=1 Tax=Chitinophaga sp. TaxID=1869181 RepID=UPI001B0B8C93|nr:response regulator transcription factor [Chitinophaga sp.]MBO9732448.1 response regulator transcription factor [Chitinophaga sp.]